MCFRKDGDSVITVFAVTKEQKMVTDCTIEGLSSLDVDWYWVDFHNPTEEEVLLLETYFHFHPLAIEDCLHFIQRPKINFYEKNEQDTYTFFVLNALNQNTYEAEEVDVFLGKNYIVSFHKGELHGLSQFRNRIEKQSVAELSPVYILHALIDNLVDEYFPIIYKVEDQILLLEDKKNMLPTKTIMEQLYEVRSDLVTLRKSIIPMRDLLYRITNMSKVDEISNFRHYFTDVYEHLLKLAEMVETNRELSSDIRDNQLSIQSSRANSIMMILTIITVIFMPLTFIAGIYGMNFENMPELKYKYGYFIVLGAMFLITFIMIVLFRKKDWFKY